MWCAFSPTSLMAPRFSSRIAWWMRYIASISSTSRTTSLVSNANMSEGSGEKQKERRASVLCIELEYATGLIKDMVPLAIYNEVQNCLLVFTMRCSGQCLQHLPLVVVQVESICELDYYEERQPVRPRRAMMCDDPFREKICATASSMSLKECTFGHLYALNSKSRSRLAAMHVDRLRRQISTCKARTAL